MIRPKKLQKYTSIAVGDGGTTLSTLHSGRGPVCFQNFITFCLNLDGGKLYMKIVAFDEIYNFVL
jgi:hypothetical protein